jgi:hypothetical protein
MREGGTRATPILGVEFVDRRLSSSEPESSLALVVAHLPAPALQAPVDAEVSDRSVVALSGFELAILNRSLSRGWPRSGGGVAARARPHRGTGRWSRWRWRRGVSCPGNRDGAQAWTPLSKTADDLIRDLDRRLSSTSGGQFGGK